MSLMSNFDVTVAYTHSGTFHADDVFSAILLKRVFPGIEIRRVSRVPGYVEDCTIVFDIGGGVFDHHQEEKVLREDTAMVDGKEVRIPYAAFGLLWKRFGHQVCFDQDAWKKFDRDFVLPIDACDNGIYRSTLSAAVASMNPNWNEDITPDEAFEYAVSAMSPIFESELRRVNSAAKAKSAVYRFAAQMADDRVLVLNQYLPWQDAVIEELPSVLFVVFPSNRGGWNVQTVPDAPGSFTGRKGFPSEWLGDPDRSLGMTFCHTGNFLACTETLEQAINVATIAADR